MATFDLENLGGTWPAQIPAVTTHPGRLDIFLIGGNRELYHYWQNDGEPFGLESLGGSFKLQPASAVTRDSGHIVDVFAVGTDNKIHHYSQRLGDSFDHEVVAEGLQPGDGTNLLKAVTDGSRRWDLFVTGDAHFSLEHYWWPRASGGAPLPFAPLPHESLGGTISGGRSLSATVGSNRRFDVFFLEATRAPTHFWQNAGEPFRSESMPDPYWDQDTSLEAVTWGPGRLDLFTAASNSNSGSGSIQHFWQPDSAGWGNERVAVLNTGRATPSSRPWPLAAVSWGSPRLDFFRTNGPGTPLFHHWREGGSVFASENLGGAWSHGFDAVSWGPRRLDVFAVGDNEELYHYQQG